MTLKQQHSKWLYLLFNLLWFSLKHVLYFWRPFFFLFWQRLQLFFIFLVSPQTKVNPGIYDKLLSRMRSDTSQQKPVIGCCRDTNLNVFTSAADVQSFHHVPQVNTSVSMCWVGMNVWGVLVHVWSGRHLLNSILLLLHEAEIGWWTIVIWVWQSHCHFSETIESHFKLEFVWAVFHAVWLASAVLKEKKMVGHKTMVACHVFYSGHQEHT